VLGTVLVLNGRPFTVVGVLPTGEPWLDAADVFIPFLHNPAANRISWEWAVVARLRPGVTLDAARADLRRVSRQIAEPMSPPAPEIKV
jgi:hypothetical protein